MRRLFLRAPRCAVRATMCLAVGCTAGLTQPDGIVYGARPSVLDPVFGGIGTVTVADSVRAGAPLAVLVPTEGGGACARGRRGSSR